MPRPPVWSATPPGVDQDPQHEAAESSAQELRDHVEARFLPGLPLRKPERQTDRGVHVTARRRADRVCQSHQNDAERQRHSQHSHRLDAADCGADCQEHQEEGANEFGDEFVRHVYERTSLCVDANRRGG